MVEILKRVSSRGTQTNHKNDKMQNKKVISFYDNYQKSCRHSGKKNSQDKLNLRVRNESYFCHQLLKLSSTFQVKLSSISIHVLDFNA